MPTQARKRFEGSCSDVKRLLAIHKDIAGDAPGRKYGVEVLSKSAIVLICAYWEAYIEDIVAEALEFTVAKVVDPAKLPLELRKIIARMVKQDPNDLTPWNLAGEGWRSVLKQNLDVALKRYLSNWNTPKSANIRALYEQALGLQDLPATWQRSWLSSTKAIRKLDDFVTLRGAIAHRGKSAQSVKKQVVNNAFAHVQELVQFTDEATNAHVKSVTGHPLF